MFPYTVIGLWSDTNERFVHHVEGQEPGEAIQAACDVMRCSPDPEDDVRERVLIVAVLAGHCGPDMWAENECC